MEGAVRLFAGEFDQATLTVACDDDRSAAWVVTPSAAFCRIVFLAGALVGVQETGGLLTARLADPTGGFDLVCSGSSSPVAESIRKIPLPSFVSVSGRAQLYRKDGKAVLSVRPETVQVIDRRVRDQWVVTTAAITLARLEVVRAALRGAGAGPGVLKACSHYSLAPADLEKMAAMVAGALSGVRPAEETVAADGPEPRVLIMDFIRASSGPRGVSVDDILEMAGMRAISRDAALAAIESLVVDDECYQPQKGYLRPL